jgi:hypothetical protein
MMRERERQISRHRGRREGGEGKEERRKGSKGNTSVSQSRQNI